MSLLSIRVPHKKMTAFCPLSRRLTHTMDTNVSSAGGPLMLLSYANRRNAHIAPTVFSCDIMRKNIRAHLSLSAT